MINAVIGDVVSVKEGVVVLRAGYVEYSMIVSGQTEGHIAALRGEEKRNVRLLTVLSHHEDSMLLYGFSDELEREAFNQLQNVNGIGPRQALKILSGITVDNLARALDEGNVKLLSTVPGVGSKTAQKMILQLRGKLVIDEEEERASRSQKSKRFVAVAESLAAMGYDRRSADEAVSHVENEAKKKLETLTMNEQEQLVFRLALKYLG